MLEQEIGNGGVWNISGSFDMNGCSYELFTKEAFCLILQQIVAKTKN